MQSAEGQAEEAALKVVVVGDGAVGKTSLLISLTSGAFPVEYVPTVCGAHAHSLIVDGVVRNLEVYDTAGGEEFERLSRLLYNGAHVVLLCFSVASAASLQRVQSRVRWRAHRTLGAPDCAPSGAQRWPARVLVPSACSWAPSATCGAVYQGNPSSSTRAPKPRLLRAAFLLVGTPSVRR